MLIGSNEMILAIHEAGHAVIAHASGARIFEIWITDCNGLCLHSLLQRTVNHDLLFDDDLRSAYKRAVILLSGEMAERKYQEDNVDTFLSEDDRLKLSELAADIHGDELKPAAEWIGEMEVLSNKLVSQNWPAIYALAGALVEQPRLANGRRYLSGPEATQIILTVNLTTKGIVWDEE